MNNKHTGYITLCISLAVLMNTTFSCFAQERDTAWQKLSARLSPMNANWTAVPKEIINHKFTTGMLLGNGDIGVVVGDALNRQTFYFGKSDFWGASVKRPSDPQSIWQASILSLGGLTVSSPEINVNTSAFHQQQDMVHAVVNTTMQFGSAIVKMVSWPADADTEKENNLFITKLVSDKKVSLHIRLWVPSNYKYGGKLIDCSAIYPYTSGATDGILWTTRQNYNNPHADRHGEYKARVAIATSLKGASFYKITNTKGEVNGDFILKPGLPVYLVVTFSSAEAVDWAHCPSVEAIRKKATRKVAALTSKDIVKLKNEHENWWKKYWLRSYVNLHDSVLGKFYYGSLYVLGCASRQGSFPPSLFGNWITTDLSSWGGRYFLNYNEEAAYYGVCSANRPALLKPYIHLILHEAPWQENKTHRAGYKGICHQRSMTPYHLITPQPAIVPVAQEKNYKKLPADQKSNGAFAAMPLIWYYEYTDDTIYLRKKLYPYLKKLEAFYNDYMDKSSKPYHIRHSSAHEGSDDMDPNLDIGFCRRLCRTLISESKVLHTDAALRPIWRDVLQNLADYPTIIRNGEKVYTESATKDGSTDPDKLFHPGDQPINLEGAVFPGENIFIGGDSVQLQIARNSLAQVGGWCVNRGGSEHNGFPKVWPIASRIDWPAKDLFHKLKAAIIFHWRSSNLTAFQGGGGIETVGALEGINSMLMQSEGGIIRVFPDWPVDKDASFTRLRAKGAFLISSSLKNGRVKYVRIRSERGGDVVLKNPWGTHQANIIDKSSGKTILYRIEENKIHFDTQKGKTYFLTD